MREHLGLDPAVELDSLVIQTGVMADDLIETLGVDVKIARPDDPSDPGLERDLGLVGEHPVVPLGVLGDLLELIGSRRHAVQQFLEMLGVDAPHVLYVVELPGDILGFLASHLPLVDGLKRAPAGATARFVESLAAHQP